MAQEEGVMGECAAWFSLVVGFASNDGTAGGNEPSSTMASNGSTQNPWPGAQPTAGGGFVQEGPSIQDPPGTSVGWPSPFRGGNGVAVSTVGSVIHTGDTFPYGGIPGLQGVADEFDAIEVSVKLDTNGHTLHDGQCHPHVEPCGGMASVIVKIKKGSLATGGAQQGQGTQPQRAPNSNGPVAGYDGNGTVSNPVAGESEVTQLPDDADGNHEYKIKCAAAGCGTKRTISMALLGSSGSGISTMPNGGKSKNLVVALSVGCEPC